MPSHYRDQQELRSFMQANAWVKLDEALDAFQEGMKDYNIPPMLSVMGIVGVRSLQRVVDNQWAYDEVGREWLKGERSYMRWLMEMQASCGDCSLFYKALDTVPLDGHWFLLSCSVRADMILDSMALIYAR